MSWNNIKHKIARFYSAIWKNIEPVKTVLLTLLIGLSIFLTWNLWTYTPNLQELPDGTIDSKIEQGVKTTVQDVIQPMKVILHQNKKHYWSPSMGVGKQTEGVYERLQKATLVAGDPLPIDEVDELSEGFEVIFPTAVPAPALQKVFEFSKENPFSAEPGGIKTLYIYKKGKDWMVRFIPAENENSKFVYEFQITDANHLTNIDDEYRSDLQVEELDRFELNGKAFYLPKRGITLQSLNYRIDDLGIEPFVKLLLPQHVKIDESKFVGTKSFMQYYKDREIFVYTSPSIKTNQSDALEEHVTVQGMNFINSHTGWTDQFQLYEFSDANSNYEGYKNYKEIQYRLTLNGFPLMDDALSLIELEYSNQELYRYKRSLLVLDKPLQLEPTTVKLENGAEVVRTLRQLSGNEINVKDITIGYYVDINDNRTVELIPAWYYKVGTAWKKINFDDNELFENKGR
ncbi:YycH family regulatory protein [Pseudalkalibacillus decolorationis]|uniref:YycH family regulatory protein n=1 Tax=Pseudalkalibacillus decolorationis TaxID=163879 RepID=UPI002148C147|nr:two-component system activity regulator YycH [Pseudalkalibacillus decolorationis]